MKYISLVLSLLILISCQENGTEPQQAVGNQSSLNSSNDSQLMTVYKANGATQCQSTGTSANVMSQELTNSGIDVTCYYKSNDILLKENTCGAATGVVNVFEINKSNFTDAVSLGFISTKLLPKIITAKCESNVISKTPVYKKVYKNYLFRHICSDRSTTSDYLADELIAAGVNVACSQKGSHFFLSGNVGAGFQPAVCRGIAQGYNVFTINEKDIPTAITAGFNPVSELPNYVDSKCLPLGFTVPNPSGSLKRCWPIYDSVDPTRVIGQECAY